MYWPVHVITGDISAFLRLGIVRHVQLNQRLSLAGWLGSTSVEQC